MERDADSGEEKTPEESNGIRANKIIQSLCVKSTKLGIFERDTKKERERERNSSRYHFCEPDVKLDQQQKTKQRERERERTLIGRAETALAAV